MAIAKVILNGVTQMDVTQKTVTAGSMLSGTTALKNDGTDITGSIASQAAQTIHPSTTDQTIASGKYLTGTQTIKAVTTTNLTAANIVQGVTVKIGDSTDDDCVKSVTGTAATGGNDFVITLTEKAYTYPTTYEPDCTFAEALSAYQSEKNIAFISYDGNPCAYYYDSENSAFMYAVIMSYSTSNWHAVGYLEHMWTNAGVTVVADPEQTRNLMYFTDNATALPADVASGKVFYNANGYQVGTASGGGGGGPTLLSSQTVELSCTSTSWTLLETLDVGTDVFYDGIVYVKIRDTAGRRAGYFYGSDSYIYNMHYISNLTTVTAAAISNNIGWYCGTSTTNLTAARNNSQTTEQGYYGLRAIQANTDGELTIWGRYNTTYSRTINSTYKVDVYLLPYPGGTFA